MSNATGKKILHGVCGAVVGAIAGAVIMLDSAESNSTLAWSALAGAVVLGLLAFFFTEYFWEELVEWIKGGG